MATAKDDPIDAGPVLDDPGTIDPVAIDVPVNYERITGALETHRRYLAGIEAASASLVLARQGQRCYLSIEGDTGQPIVVGRDDAIALLQTAISGMHEVADDLAVSLNTLAAGLPQ